MSVFKNILMTIFLSKPNYMFINLLTYDMGSQNMMSVVRGNTILSVFWDVYSKEFQTFCDFQNRNPTNNWYDGCLCFVVWHIELS